MIYCLALPFEFNLPEFDADVSRQSRDLAYWNRMTNNIRVRNSPANPQTPSRFSLECQVFRYLKAQSKIDESIRNIVDRIDAQLC